MNKHKFNLPCLLLFWVVPFVLTGQRYISGQITDAEDGYPIPGASVFFDNTTVGAATDAEGHYQLKMPGEGIYRLTITHVGYQSVYKDIESGSTSVVFDAALSVNQLEEVTVAASVRFRQTDINLFWYTILGHCCPIKI